MHRLTELIGVTVTLICVSPILCQSLNRHSSGSLSDTGYKDSNFDGRVRRVAGMSLAFKGFVAAKTLLVGTKSAKTSSKMWRKYEKPGDLQTAILDYYSVNPTESVIMSLRLSTKTHSGKVLSGTVGDRWVVLFMDGDKYSRGRPVLEIIDTKASQGPNRDRIVYVQRVLH